MMKIKVNISEGQKAKISRAINSGTGTNINFTHSDLVVGEHIMASHALSVKH
jgi:hypothetical protein